MTGGHLSLHANRYASGKADGVGSGLVALNLSSWALLAAVCAAVATHARRLERGAGGEASARA